MLGKIRRFIQAIRITLKMGPEEITGLQKENTELRRKALRDELTGAYNRWYLEEVGTEKIKQAERYGTPFSLVMVDIYRFKEINDTRGHSGGDKVLCNLVAFLEKSCREADIIYRYGGDEFVVALPNTDRKGAEELIKRLRRLAPKSSLGLNFGAASWSESLSLKDLLKEADAEMYKDKQNRREEENRGL